MEKQLSPQKRKSTRLRDSLKLEKQKFSYANLESDLKRNVDNAPPSSSRNHQKQRVERNSVENEELVKCMSRLPSYLESGKNLQERALSLGVLDWSHIEKWQYTNKQMPLRSSGCSPSSSTASSFFSTDGSSTHSSTGQIFSASCRRMHRPTLQAFLKASPYEAYSQSFQADAERFRDFKPTSKNPSKGRQSVLRTYQYSDINHSEIELKECKRKDSGPLNAPEIHFSRKVENFRGPSLLKGTTKIPDGESTKSREKYPSEDSHSAISYSFDSTALKVRRSSEASRRSCGDGSFSEATYRTELYSGIPHSCPLPSDNDVIKNSQTKETASKNEESFESPSEASHCYAKTSICPPISKNVEEKSSTTVPTNSKMAKSLKGSDLNSTGKDAKARDMSPVRRFGIGMGRIGRSSSAKDGSEGPVAPAFSEKSTTGKSNPASGSRSIPLRRLIDPLLKPKASNSHNYVEPSKKDSKACKSDERVISSTVQPGKVKFVRDNCKTSQVQAFLQVAIKNGLPIFTFAVDSNSEILAATVRMLTTFESAENSLIYTFLTVSEVKKKNGWINQGSRGKGHGYVPNVVAQMKVSDSESSKLTKHKSTDQFRVREFVLFSVDLTQADQEIPDLQPKEELAAIVVKLQNEASKELNQDGQESTNFDCRPMIGLKLPLTELKGNFNSRDDEKNGSFVGGRDLFSTTVVLPGSVHGLPSKGEPSPLLERWRSGGLCDCGGWDVGCRLRVLSDQTQLGKRPISSKPHPDECHFELFSQGGALDDMPIFSLSPLKDGIFSVQFSSSLTHLQAFSICVAVLNSGKPFELSELRDSFEEKYSAVTKFAENDEAKAHNTVKVEVPARYAYYPPHSPVGRV